MMEPKAENTDQLHETDPISSGVYCVTMARDHQIGIIIVIERVSCVAMPICRIPRP